MMTDDDSQTHSQLKRLWEEGTRDVAVLFLRRAIRPDMTLAELATVLAFDSVRCHLDAIKLRHVLHSPRAETPRSEEHMGLAPQSRGRRQRASRKHASARKNVVLRRLLHANQGLSSPQLGAALHERGYSTDAAKTYTLLKSLQDAGYIVGEGDRPKTWTLTASGRNQAREA